MKDNTNVEYEVVEGVHDVSIDRINDMPTKYNRPIAETAMKDILKSIRSYGYHPSQVIELNDRMQVIDGQHRVTAARIAGIKTLPVVVLKFRDLEDEAKFCHIRNMLQKKPTAKEQWLQKRYANDFAAMLMYHLVKDPASELYRSIELLKPSVKLNSAKKISAAKVGHAFNLAVLNVNVANKTVNFNRLNEKIKETSYAEIRKELNTIFGLFYGAFGGKKEAPVAYRDHIFRPFLSFVKLLKDKGVLYTNLKGIINKMKTFPMTASLLELTQAEVTNRFKKHYNSGRKEENRI